MATAMATAMAAAMATAVAVAVTRLGLGLVWLCHLIVVLFSEHFRPVKTIAKQKVNSSCYKNNKTLPTGPF